MREGLEDVQIPIDDIYIPVKRRNTLEPTKVESLAESIMEEGQKAPIWVRPDEKKRYVLVEGLHRLEACRALGESTITAIVVQATKH